MLEDVRDRGVPEAISARSMARARRDVAEQATPFGNLQQTCKFLDKQGTYIELPIQAPLAMLHFAAEYSPQFAKYITDAFRQRPSSFDKPWEVVLYCDEVVCGNPLAHKQGRKVQGVYWSLLELGATALSDELCWFEAAAYRTTITSRLLGGMSQVKLQIMRCFMGTDGPDIRRGVLLNVGGEPMTIFAKFGFSVADIPALSSVIGCKGASGTKPCPLCKNVVSKRSGLADAENGFVCVTSVDTARMKLHTDRSLHSLLLYLRRQSAALNKSDFEALTTMHGYNNLDINFYVDNDFNAGVVTGFIFDFMHIFFVNGCFNQEAFGLLKTVGRERFANVVDMYVLPRTTRKVAYLFSAKKWKACIEAKVFKCTATEGLILYPLMGHWCRSVVLPSGQYVLQAESFVALAHALDLLVLSRNGFEVQPDRLYSAVLDWLQKHKAAYGDKLWKPKHHFSIHLPTCLCRVKFLIACWVHERHHKVIKRFVKDHLTMTGLEVGLCQELTAQKVYELRNSSLTKHNGIQNLRMPSQQVATRVRANYGVCPEEQVLIGHVARVQSRSMRSKDVVLAMVDGRATAGEIVFFYRAESQGDMVIFDPWTFVGSDATVARFRLGAARRRSLALGQMLEAVVYKSLDDVRHVLVPLHWRHVFGSCA